MPTRSTNLAAINTGPAQTTLFTVPAGQTYLVKSVVVLNRQAVAAAVYLYLVDPNGAVVAFAPLGQAIPASGRFEWEGWVAMNPGQSMQVAVAVGACDFWVSGTKLPGVA